MISKFTVANYKGFNGTFSFDLKQPKGYEFNTDSIKHGVVNNGIIYGHNGVGKSNLGLAIFDIVDNLTDTQRNEFDNKSFLNAESRLMSADFQYEFVFKNDIVVYQYSKFDKKTFISEKLEINGVTFASINRNINNKAIVDFKGAEALKTELPNRDLSLLKYIKNNTVLEDNKENNILNLFFQFVDGMLFFRSLDNNMYLGLETGPKGIEEDIIEQENVNDLESFLNDAGIQCKLDISKDHGLNNIVFDFGTTKIPFYEIASTGTKALTLFYFWMQRIRMNSKVTFLFIDEFDAFYHHDLSTSIVEQLKESGVQFILTTHNTSIISNDLLRPDCYFLMNSKAIKSLAGSTSKDLREAHNIEKMYKSGSFYV